MEIYWVPALKIANHPLSCKPILQCKLLLFGLGNLYREGKTYATGEVEVFDHDYHYLGEGAVIPHGIFDLQHNVGYITIGNSHETAQFIADNLLWWWDNHGINNYPKAKTILILCDAGGANSYRHYAF